MGALSDRLVVGILGAGRMAQGFDDPHSPHVLSLAHAVHVSPGFRLGGFFDRRPERAELAERRWGCPQSTAPTYTMCSPASREGSWSRSRSPPTESRACDCSRTPSGSASLSSSTFR